MLVYVHGNCQARAIAQMLIPHFPEWNIAFYEVFKEDIIEQIDVYRSLVEKADLIISQPIHEGYRDRDDLSLAWIKSAASRKTPVITFPSMYFGGQLLGWTSLPLPGYRMDYHNALHCYFALSDLTPDEVAEEILSESLFDDTFIDNEIELSIREISRREQADAVDVPLSPFLDRYARTLPLFHTINHPYRPALAFMANSILNKIGYSPKIPDEGEDHIQFPHIPCKPCVIRYLSKSSSGTPSWNAENGRHYHFHDGQMENNLFTMKYIENLRKLPRKLLENAVNDHRAKPILERINVAFAAADRNVRLAGATGPSNVGSTSNTREILMRFESLGGAGHGCEFGLLQREFGAEPLSLLRWADLSQDFLCQALLDRFAGVGEPAFTEIFTPTDDPWQEWWSRDTRYWMVMRTFIPVDHTSHDEVQQKVCKRQKYLRDKLLVDLATGEKIFVFKNMYGTIAPQSLDRLYRAVRSYGNNVMLYIAYEDDDHPNGMVEVRAPGLLVAYIDHFGFSPKNEKLAPATQSFLAICRRTLDLVDSGAARQEEVDHLQQQVNFKSVEDGLAQAAAAVEKGDQEAALNIWSLLREYEPGHSAAYLRAASLLAERGRPEDAEDLVAKGVQNCPKDSSLSIWYAMLPHHKGDFSEALRRWEIANSRFPNHPSIEPHYLNLLQRRGS